MGILRVAIRDTFEVNMDDVLSRVTLKCAPKEARKAVRHEVQFLVSEMCERLMDTPTFSEKYFAWHLCREGLADPLPGHEPPGWEGVLYDRAHAVAG